ncbi:MAG: hypothetical protein HFF17_02420 [Oscillospiraceae bacterium]|nr:hypothetical protein [Oscillospiraceae bacterium]
MDQANFLHHPPDRPLAMDRPRGLRQALVLPGQLPPGEIPVKNLTAHLQNPTAQGNFSLLPAAVCLFRKELHPRFLADFRRLAAKKALASAKNSFLPSAGGFPAPELLSAVPAPFYPPSFFTKQT